MQRFHERPIFIIEKTEKLLIKKIDNSSVLSNPNGDFQ